MDMFLCLTNGNFIPQPLSRTFNAKRIPTILYHTSESYMEFALKYFITKLFYGTGVVQNYHMLASVHISIGKQ